MLTLLAIVALAWETDQVTDRALPLADVVGPANAEVDRRLDVAIAQTNARTRCAAPEEEVRRVLARRIHRETGRRERVPGRGLLRGLGYGTYAAWLETAPLERRSFPRGTGVYAEVGPAQSVILGTVGVCSTITLAGVLVGTDKVDHFWAVGFDYARRSDWGRRPERSVTWGTLSERTWWGRLTSNAFSFGDLRANWDGEQFYATLLEPGSVVALREDGCVERVRGFEWSEWVVPAWDEAVNPPVLGRHVARAVDRRLARGEACGGYPAWGPDYERLLEATLVEPMPWAGRHAPLRTDPWQLPERCDASLAEAP